MKVCCHINGFVAKLISAPQPALIALRGSAVGWREDKAREGWKDRFVWEWLMEFPSLWAPLASVTKGLLKERGSNKRRRQVRQRWSEGREAQRDAHLMVFHMSNPSSGFVPLVLPPARPTRVGSQSEMWMSSRLTVPGCFSSGLATNPTPRIPPSHRDHFLPRRGQLLPPYSVWPPLSVQQVDKTRRFKISKLWGCTGVISTWWRWNVKISPAELQRRPDWQASTNVTSSEL